MTIFSVNPPLRGRRDYLRMADIVSSLAEAGRLACPANITISKPARHPLVFRAETTPSCGSLRTIGKLDLLKAGNRKTYQIHEDPSKSLKILYWDEDYSCLIRPLSSVEAVIEPHAQATYMDRVDWGGSFLYDVITQSERKPLFVQARLVNLPARDAPLRIKLAHSLGMRLLTFDVFSASQRCMNISVMPRSF